MPFNYDRVQRKALRLINRFGRADAALRRDGADRACTAVVIEFSPRERDLVEVGARRALVAAKGLAVAPDYRQDELVWMGEVYKIVAPDTGPRPGGTTIYHDLQVVYNRVDA
jgi:hypothetical protein